MQSQTEASGVVNKQVGENSPNRHAANDDIDKQSAEKRRIYPRREGRVRGQFPSIHTPAGSMKTSEELNGLSKSHNPSNGKKQWRRK